MLRCTSLRYGYSIAFNIIFLCKINFSLIHLIFLLRTWVIDLSFILKNYILISHRLFRIISECFYCGSGSMRSWTTNFIIVIIVLIMSYSKSLCIHVWCEWLDLSSIWLLSIKNYISSLFTIRFWLLCLLHHLIKRCFWFWISVMSSNNLLVNSCLFLIVFSTQYLSNRTFLIQRDRRSQINWIHLQGLYWTGLLCNRLPLLILYQLDLWYISRLIMNIRRCLIRLPSSRIGCLSSLYFLFLVSASLIDYLRIRFLRSA